MSQYYESILQLRRPTPETEQFIESAIAKAAARNVFLSKAKKVRNGIDYYLSSNKFAVELGRVLERRFGGEMKVSRELYSKDRQSSKDLYRVSVLFRPATLRTGDCIEAAGTIIKLTSISKKLSGTDLQTGKKRIIAFNSSLAPLPVCKSSVVVVRPRLEILHPHTFQNSPVENPQPLKPGQHVKVVVTSRGLFLV